MNENGPCLPGRVIEGTIINGAKKEKKGPSAKCGMFCEGNFDLEYEGPRTPDELFDNDDFRDVQPVKVGQAKVMRCRPIFKNWEATIIVNYDDELINPEELERWLGIAGQQVGIGDFRPRHGRFSVAAAVAA
jgi:hypothetical protein